MIQRFWLWLYKLARSHLPPDYYDELLGTYVAERIERLRGQLGDDFVCWFVSDIGPPDPRLIGRDTRDAIRDIRFPR